MCIYEVDCKFIMSDAARRALMTVVNDNTEANRLCRVKTFCKRDGTSAKLGKKLLFINDTYQDDSILFRRTYRFCCLSNGLYEINLYTGNSQLPKITMQAIDYCPCDLGLNFKLKDGTVFEVHCNNLETSVILQKTWRECLDHDYTHNTSNPNYEEDNDMIVDHVGPTSTILSPYHVQLQ